MPLYDYKCKKCGHIFEVQQHMTDAPLKKCPKCEGEIHRLISAAGIVFKGSGFHVTDYGRPKTTEKEKPKVDSRHSKAEDKKTTTGTESSATAVSHPKSE